MFNSDSKSIITRTTWETLKKLGLNGFVTLIKQLISGTNRKKKFQFAREHGELNVEHWKNVGRWIFDSDKSDLPCSRVIGASV